ncbi:MAG: acyl-CoA dehydrogenase, partial [Aestuariivirga sp.]
MTALPMTKPGRCPSHLAIAQTLGQQFARHAAKADEEDCFVADNYAALKTSGLVEAGVPAELGGGGAEIAALADMLRI